MKCNTCYFIGLFHCAHPKRYIEPFLKDCSLYKESETKVFIDDTVICSYCGQKVHINDTEVLAKGSKFICRECI